MSNSPLSQGATPVRPAIIRHTLFTRSEPFIPDQAAALPGPANLFARDPIQNPRADLNVTTFTSSRSNRLSYTVLRDWRSLAAALKTTSPTVIHAHFGPEGLYSLPAARRLGLPHITTLHGFDASVTTRSLLRSGRPSWVHYGARRARFFAQPHTHFICVSEHVRRLAIKQGVSPAQTSVITTGVDTKAIRVSDTQFAEPTIIHVARLVEKKGTTDLIEAMRHVVRRVPSAKLLIVGDGPLRSALAELVESLGMSHVTTFAGSVDHTDALRLISQSHVMCVPSVTAKNGDQEGLPQVLLEALAYGVPVVGTDHGGIPEAITDGRNGRIVPEHSPDDLGEALVSILTADRPDETRRCARLTAETSFDVTTQSAKVWALYESLSS